VFVINDEVRAAAIKRGDKMHVCKAKRAQLASSLSRRSKEMQTQKMC
jgi:hypothetical protein